MLLLSWARSGEDNGRGQKLNGRLSWPTPTSAPGQVHWDVPLHAMRAYLSSQSAPSAVNTFNVLDLSSQATLSRRLTPP